MKRFNAQKELKKFGPVAGVKLGVLALDLAVAYANICLIEEKLVEGSDRRLQAIHRASMRVVELVAGELVGLVDKELRLQGEFLMMPRGIGRVCEFCGCSEHDPCLEGEWPGGAPKYCHWSSKSIPYVRDVCSACEAEGYADGTEPRKTEAELPGSGGAGDDAPGQGAADQDEDRPRGPVQ